MNTKLSHRFVKEYANYKIRVFRELAKSFPEKAEYSKAKIETIESWLGCWNRNLITIDEIMGMISEV